MKPTHNAKTPRAATGLFALLGDLFHNQGTGAPKIARSFLPALVGAALLTIPASARAFATIEAPPVFSSAPGLPDGRVYEQVSPADKNGNEAGSTTTAYVSGAEEHYGVAAANGSSVLFEGTGPMGESPPGTSLMFVASKNVGAAGWHTRAVMPAAELGGKLVEILEARPNYIDPSADLSHAMVAAGNYALGASNFQCAGPGRNQLYLLGSDPFVPGTWLEQPEVTDSVGNCGSYEDSGAPVGGTPDFSTVYFTVPGTLLPEDAARAPHAHPKVGGEGDVEAWGFYEDAAGVLREAGTLPDSSLSPFGAVPAASGHGRNPSGNQISANGLRAFFVSPDPASCAGAGGGGENNCAVDPPELYVRENGAKTQLVSKDTLLPEAGGLPASAPHGVSQMPNSVQTSDVFSGSYVFASPDGSQAFFQSTDDLTKVAEKDRSGPEPKTYEFDVNTGELTYLPGVEGEIVASDTEGTSFAFVHPEAGGESAQLDLWSAGPNGGTVTPVTQLPGPPSSDAGEDKATFYLSDARMSSDGSALVFLTSTTLPGAFNSGGVEQVYRYDIAAGTLGCVSCPPHGVVPTGNASMSPLQASETYEQYGPNVHGMVAERGISADGGRIFFDTPDPLVPQDTNIDSPELEVEQETFAKQGRDVYEWENGVIYLISGGKSSRNSLLLDNSESGDDVFFATAEGLVPGDTDGGFDVYDARVPQPGDNPPAAAVPCEGPVCQGPPRVESPLAPPARATLPGSDNLTPAVAPPPPKKATTKTVKCKKGFTKKNNKCTVRHERGGKKGHRARKGSVRS